jgi:predicted phage terminase large subunit-like protein
MIKRNWIQRYTDLSTSHERPLILQSWDTANKGGPENDFSVCTTWLVTRDRRWYLLDVWRKRVDYPELKAALQTLATRHKARRVLVEDAGSGTFLFQELRSEVDGIVAVKPERDKIVRMSVVSAKFERASSSFPRALHGSQISKPSYLRSLLAGMTINAIPSAKLCSRIIALPNGDLRRSCRALEATRATNPAR